MTGKRLRNSELEKPAWPVTASEVDGMFREASVRGPWPGAETCAHVATFLSNNMDERPLPKIVQETIDFLPASEMPPLTKETFRRRREAATLLKAAIAETFQRRQCYALPPAEAASLGALKAAIDGAERTLFPSGSSSGWIGAPKGTKDWHPIAFVTADLALFVLAEECGSRARTVGRNTVAARFTELALRRLGYVGAEREAIASLWAKWSRTTPPE
jgi:hypothetical protein